MSEYMIMEDFKVSYDDQELAAHFRVRPGSKAEGQLMELIGQARALARPKAAFKVMSPDIVDEETVRFDGVSFESELMVRHLTGLETALPYVATCGRELAEWTAGLTGLAQYMADEIMLMALRQAVEQLERYLIERFEMPTISAMNPGSLAREWPITGQIPLFELLGELPGRIGVKLLPSLLMDPGKSVSGLFFQTEEEYHNCQLCLKEGCPSRKAPYQAEGVGL